MQSTFATVVTGSLSEL